jgi:hypothetical protein
VIFTTYGPPGIGEERIREELIVLEEYVSLVSPDLVSKQLVVL